MRMEAGNIPARNSVQLLLLLLSILASGFMGIAGQGVRVVRSQCKRPRYLTDKYLTFTTFMVSVILTPIEF